MNARQLADRIGGLTSTAVNRVLAEARQLQALGRQLVSLMRGQPDTPTPEPIVEAAIKALRDGRTGYPDNQGEPALRQAVAGKLLRENGLTYNPDREILVTDGATCGLAAALAVLLNPGDEVLLPDPIYDAYGSAIALWGGRAVGVRSIIRDGRFGFDRAALEAACTPRSKMLLLNSPWNPVGTALTKEELQETVRFAADHDLTILSDEIYETLIYDGNRHLSPATLSDDARQRTIVVNSLSKTYAMTGWRVGYCAAREDIISAMLLVLQQWSRGPATFVQDAAVAALSLPATWSRDLAAEYQRRRDLVIERLRGVPGAQLLVPEGGLFVMVDITAFGFPSDEVRRSLLRDVGVIVIHGAAYGEGGEGTLRVSFAAGGETLARGLDRLREGLRRLADTRASKGQR